MFEIRKRKFFFVEQNNDDERWGKSFLENKRKIAASHSIDKPNLLTQQSLVNKKQAEINVVVSVIYFSSRVNRKIGCSLEFTERFGDYRFVLFIQRRILLIQPNLVFQYDRKSLQFPQQLCAKFYAIILQRILVDELRFLDKSNYNLSILSLRMKFEENACEKIECSSSIQWMKSLSHLRFSNFCFFFNNYIEFQRSERKIECEWLLWIEISRFVWHFGFE